VALDWIEEGLSAVLRVGALETATQALARRIAERVRRCLGEAGLDAADVDAVFLTGGSTLLPHVRRGIVGELPGARIVEGDKFGAVGLGLTIEALRRLRIGGKEKPRRRGDTEEARRRGSRASRAQNPPLPSVSPWFSLPIVALEGPQEELRWASSCMR